MLMSLSQVGQRYKFAHFPESVWLSSYAYFTDLFSSQSSFNVKYDVSDFFLIVIRVASSS